MKERKTLKDYVINIPKGIKKVITGVALLGMVSIIGSPQVHARDPQLEINNFATKIIVKGYATDPSKSGSDYVGMTMDTNHNGTFDCDDYNFRAKRVSKGKFSTSFDLLSLVAEGMSGNFTIALWDEIVNNCGCEWCDREGYHMTGELARGYGELY